MAGSLKRTSGGRNAGVGAEGTAPETPKSAFYAVPDRDGDVLDIPLSDISRNPFNDRDLGDLKELAESIRVDGPLQDIVVMRTEAFAKVWPDQAAGLTTKFVIAFGERRWLAHGIADRKTIRAALQDHIVPRIRKLLLLENMLRKNYSPMEEARNFQRLNVEEGMSFRAIATELHTTLKKVSSRLELLKLPKELQDAVDKGDLLPTHGRRLFAELETPEERIAAFSLMCGEEPLSIAQAIRSVQQSDGDLSDLGSEYEVPGPRQERAEDEEPVEAEHVGDPDLTQGDASTAADDPPAGDVQPIGGESPVPPGNTSAKPKSRAASTEVSAADRYAAQRNRASADRAAACQAAVANWNPLTASQQIALLARTVLTSVAQGPARTRSHAWLRAAGTSGFNIDDTDSYFQAVLDSPDEDLKSRATLVTALAACEVRARDGRRQWDASDAAHVGLLIELGYSPKTEWERSQLTKFKVELPEIADSELTD